MYDLCSFEDPKRSAVAHPAITVRCRDESHEDVIGVAFLKRH